MSQPNDAPNVSGHPPTLDSLEQATIPTHQDLVKTAADTELDLLGWRMQEALLAYKNIPNPSPADTARFAHGIGRELVRTHSCSLSIQP